MEGTSTRSIWDSYWIDDADSSWWTRPDPKVMEFISTQCSIQRPSVLDLGCGRGRHAIAFAQAGFSVSATDISEIAVSRLCQRAEELSLRIRTQVCDVCGDTFPDRSFDIVLSYNVIYHGLRAQFAAAIKHVHALLKTDGLFYFTSPTRDDGKYGYGREIAPHTYLCEKSVTPNDIHYFADEADLDQFLAGFRQVSRTREEGYWDNRGARQFYSNWIVVAQKA